MGDNEDCETQPGDTQPHGQKCLYKHTGTDGWVTTGTHTTPIHRYVDDLTFTLIPENGCIIEGHSISETLSVLDFGTNFCNLFNLMDGSGLTQDPAFTETPVMQSALSTLMLTMISTKQRDFYKK